MNMYDFIDLGNTIFPDLNNEVQTTLSSLTEDFIGLSDTFMQHLGNSENGNEEFVGLGDTFMQHLDNDDNAYNSGGESDDTYNSDEDYDDGFHNIFGEDAIEGLIDVDNLENVPGEIEYIPVNLGLQFSSQPNFDNEMASIRSSLRYLEGSSVYQDLCKLSGAIQGVVQDPAI